MLFQLSLFLAPLLLLLQPSWGGSGVRVCSDSFGSWACVSSLSALSGALRHAESADMWPMVFPAPSLQDPYLIIHKGWLFSLFADRTYPIQYDLDRDVSSEESLRAARAEYAEAIRSMPRRSILVYVQLNYDQFLTLEEIAALTGSGIGPSVLVHVNHEKPWMVSDRATSGNYVTKSLQRLRELYSSFDLVFRNYHFEPLTSSASGTTYLPLGPSNYGCFLGNNSDENPIGVKITARTSERRQLCSFVGRLLYSEPAGHANAFERELLVDLLRANYSGLAAYCEIQTPGDPASDFDHIFQVKYPYYEYIRRAADTAFMLCPSGNNPETFRLYEALELGAVPVLARHLEADRSFLSHPLWRDYPGPVLDSWYDLADYVSSMSGTAADGLQQSLRLWYKEFKQRLVWLIAYELDYLLLRGGAKGSQTVGSAGEGAGDGKGEEGSSLTAPRALLRVRDVGSAEGAVCARLRGENDRLLAEVRALEERVRALTLREL